jgi:outer membrane immunogenic protein
MRKTLYSATAAAVLLAGSWAAQAADLAPVYRAPAPFAPVFTWTGFYVGAQAGGKWSDTTWTATSLRDPPGVSPLFGVTATGIDASSPRSFNTSAGRFGGHVGYNWQASRWVLGVEADAAYSEQQRSAFGLPGCTISCFLVGAVPFSSPLGGGDASSVTMNWDASVRGRIGYLATPDVLLYATGGAAWQNVETSATCGPIVTSNYCASTVLAPAATLTRRTTLTGWTIGGGIEWRVYGNWLLRGEYRYSDFGTFADAFVFAPAPDPVVFTNNTYRYNLEVTTHIATAGVSYKF